MSPPAVPQGFVQKALPIADLILKIATSIAIIAGGGWTLWRFVLSRNNEENVTLAISTESSPYGRDLSLLTIHVRLSNIGRVLSVPKRFYVDLREVPADGQQWKPIGLHDGKPILSMDLLASYDGYEIEPGAEYDEVKAVVVPRNERLVVDAEYVLSDDETVGTENIVRVDERRSSMTRSLSSRRVPAAGVGRAAPHRTD